MVKIVQEFTDFSLDAEILYEIKSVKICENLATYSGMQKFCILLKGHCHRRASAHVSGRNFKS